MKDNLIKAKVKYTIIEHKGSSYIQKFRYILFTFIFISILFVYYANYSIYVKHTVLAFYQSINHEFTGLYKKDVRAIDANIQTNSNTTKNLIDLLNKYISNQSKYDMWNHSSNNYENICPLIPPNLGSRINLNLTHVPEIEIEKFLENKNLSVKFGGQAAPKECQSRHKVAIVIPYRDRQENLELFLMNMHPFLAKQQLDYGIYLVEPIANISFNRGLLMNIGFVESIKDADRWQCFVFHDVDLLPGYLSIFSNLLLFIYYFRGRKKSLFLSRITSAHVLRC
jgi:hypothetical protein